MKPKLFLSHCWADKARVFYKLVETELMDSYEVWIDKRGLPGSEVIDDMIKSGIAGADVLVCIWSENALNSRHVHQEIRLAKDGNKRLIALRTDDANPKEFELFKGEMYFDLRVKEGHAADFNWGLVELRKYLRDIWMESPNLANNEELKEDIATIDEANHHLEDLAWRIKQGDSGNEAAPVYLLPALKAVKAVVARTNDPAEKQRMTGFLTDLEEIAKKYAGTDQQEEGERAMVTSIVKHDPAQQSEMLQMFRTALLGRISNRNTPPATPQSPPPPPTEAMHQTPTYVGSTFATQLQQHIAQVRNQPGSKELLKQQIIQRFPQFTMQMETELNQTMYLINQWIDEVPRLLDGIADACRIAGVAVYVEPLIVTCFNYFLDPNDLIPDHHGEFGLVDDTYLVLLTIHNTNVLYRSHTGVPMMNIDVIEQLKIFRQLIGEQVAFQLEQHSNQAIQQIVQQHQMMQLYQWGGTMNVGGYGGNPFGVSSEDARDWAVFNAMR